MSKELSEMKVYELAREIRRDWKNVNYAARPYLDAMSGLVEITDSYGLDSGASIVRYFLSNASSWRGQRAREIKAELNRRLKQPNPVTIGLSVHLRVVSLPST